MNYKISNERYSEITEEIANLYEDIGIKAFPINPIEICNKLKIKLIPYSSTDAFFTLSSDGFNYFHTSNQEYVIHYNVLQSKERINFTIMHELGHIMLGHDSPENNIENSIKEKEADYFARMSLVPLGIIFILRLRTPEEISKIFNISFSCATNVFKHYQTTKSYPRIKTQIINNRLTRQFMEYTYKLIKEVS